MKDRMNQIIKERIKFALHYMPEAAKADLKDLYIDIEKCSGQDDLDLNVLHQKVESLEQKLEAIHLEKPFEAPEEYIKQIKKLNKIMMVGIKEEEMSKYLGKLLVVEDNPKHLEDARALFDGKVKAGELSRVDYATNLQEAIEKLEETKCDGIICDIFFPSGKAPQEDEDVREKLYGALNDGGYISESDRIKSAVKFWHLGGELAPLGIYIAEIAKGRRIPFVFCTDTNHHGDATEPVYRYAQEYCIPIVDVSFDRDPDMGRPNTNAQGDRKDFETAFKAFTKGISVCGVSAKDFLEELDELEKDGDLKYLFKEGE